MTRWASAGRYDEAEVEVLIDYYMDLRYLKHRPAVHVRLMDLEVAMRDLPRKHRDVLLVYGLLRFTERAAGEALAISGREVRRRYRQGVDQILYRLNGEEE
jgi:DNA-directed RNA polymerase specialized sigma24 family protein